MCLWYVLFNFDPGIKFCFYSMATMRQWGIRKKKLKWKEIRKIGGWGEGDKTAKRFRVSPNHHLPDSPLTEIKPITVYVMGNPQLTPISHQWSY